jgi:GMP synthase-like glutamine amidotransferase
MAQTLRICMLNADVPVPAVYKERATTYGNIFHHLLCNAARITSPNLEIISQDFNVIKGKYPDDVFIFDAIIISGSANSAYDDLDWIRTLCTFIENVYQHGPRIKMFGSCFGHQLICKALVEDYGVTVEKDPRGWELGVKEITLTKTFQEVFKKVTGNGRGVMENMRLQFVHGDHVCIPHADALPPSWVLLGSTDHCAVQGIYEPGRILTFQGHFEFDRFINSETIKFFFPVWEPTIMAKTLEDVDADDDAVAAATMVLEFFIDGAKSKTVSHGLVSGLLTPPPSE